MPSVMKVKRRILRLSDRTSPTVSAGSLPNPCHWAWVSTGTRPVVRAAGVAVNGASMGAARSPELDPIRSDPAEQFAVRRSGRLGDDPLRLDPLQREGRSHADFEVSLLPNCRVADRRKRPRRAHPDPSSPDGGDPFVVPLACLAP